MRNLWANVVLYGLWGACGIVGALLGNLVFSAPLLWGLGGLLGVLCGFVAVWAWDTWREARAFTDLAAQIDRLEGSLGWYEAETGAYIGETTRLDT